MEIKRDISRSRQKEKNRAEELARYKETNPLHERVHIGRDIRPYKKEYICDVFINCRIEMDNATKNMQFKNCIFLDCQWVEMPIDKQLEVYTFNDFRFVECVFLGENLFPLAEIYPMDKFQEVHERSFPLSKGEGTIYEGYKFSYTSLERFQIENDEDRTFIDCDFTQFEGKIHLTNVTEFVRCKFSPKSEWVCYPDDKVEDCIAIYKPKFKSDFKSDFTIAYSINSVEELVELKSKVEENQKLIDEFVPSQELKLVFHRKNIITSMKYSWVSNERVADIEIKNMISGSIENSEFLNCNLTGCEFSGNMLNNKAIQNSEFRNCNLRNSKVAKQPGSGGFWRNSLVNVVFENCDLRNFIFNCDMENVIFKNCKLEGAKLCSRKGWKLEM